MNDDRSKQPQPPQKPLVWGVIRILLYVLVLLVSARGIAGAYQFGHSIFYASRVDAPPGRDVQVEIAQGSSARDVAQMLYDKKVISDKFAFEVQYRFFGIKMHPGNYTFNSSQSSREMLEQIDAGQEEGRDAK